MNIMLNSEDNKPLNIKIINKEEKFNEEERYIPKDLKKRRPKQCLLKKLDLIPLKKVEIIKDESKNRKKRSLTTYKSKWKKLDNINILIRGSERYMTCNIPEGE